MKKGALRYTKATYDGILDRQQKFMVDLRAIEERGRLGELGPVGVEKAKRDLTGEYVAAINRDMKPLVQRSRARADTLKEKLLARDVKPSANPDEAVRNALAEDRMIRRFESQPPDQQREQIRSALERGDHKLLCTLLTNRVCCRSRSESASKSN